jgi:hypothetical protein
MDRFARIVVGYHGCKKTFADGLLTGSMQINGWQLSQNAYDWLGKGIYFWEHSPRRALRWAQDFYPDEGAVVGCIIQLGGCFDLLDEGIADLLSQGYEQIKSAYHAAGKELPVNHGREKKLRFLDCAVINVCLDLLSEEGLVFDTVRGAFLEGEPLFEGTSISSETHIQIAVRNADCILGVFRPNL